RGTGHVPGRAFPAWSTKVRTDPVRGKAGGRMLSGWLGARYQGGDGSGAGRIALVAVAVLAVGAYTVLQVKARARRRGAMPGRGRRRYDPADWRGWPTPRSPGGAGDGC